MNEKTTPILVVLLVIAAFAIGSMWTKIQYMQTAPVTQPTPTTAQQPSQPAAAPSVSLDKVKALFADGFIKFGDANKKILFVEVSDPSCPFCHFAAGKNPELAKTSSRFITVADGGTYNPPVPEMRKLVEAGKASFAWIYSNGHGNGELATQALYCAFEKNKFWEAHDVIMSNKGYEAMNTAKADSTALAALLAPAVDQTFMKTCLESKKYADKITRDSQAGQSLGFQGTPYFLINTTPFSGAIDFKTGMEPLVKTLL
ncbi:MAG: thioredoxin domain-containing protein [bacterium]|nr:thioredoxin domain-containing protein [bacterium]